MANYIDSYKIGVEAASKAQVSKKEIECVFSEFVDQILEATQGKVKIIIADRKSLEKPENLMTPNEAILSRSPMAGDFVMADKIGDLSGQKYNLNKGHPVYLDSLKPKQTIDSILVATAINTNNKQSIILASWKESKIGYPCELSFGTSYIYCEDKGGLENALSELLEDPGVGEALLILANLPEPEEVPHHDQDD